MSAKRIAKSSIDWAKFSSIIPKSEFANFTAFKAKSDAYVTRVLSYPENPPQINFKEYESKVRDPKLVQQLEKAYKSVKIPYPKDNLSHEVDEQEAEFKKQADTYFELANTKILEAEKLREKFEIMIPYKYMSKEEFSLTFPDWVYSYESPSIWPHFEKTPGLSKEERAELHKPDGPPYSTIR